MKADLLIVGSKGCEFESQHQIELIRFKLNFGLISPKIKGDVHYKYFET